MIDYDALKAHSFEPVYQTYTARDCMLFALGLNIGADPLDETALQYVAAQPPRPVVTMPMHLARLGGWMKDPAVGIDYTRIVVGEVSLRLHAPLPAEATVCGRHRVVRVTDKGEGRGALVTIQRELTDASGALLAEYEQVTFCRGDGGFAVDGRHDAPAPSVPWDTGGRPPDRVISLPTSPQQALIYRLSGDMNPLHSDPAVARKAGFDRPILHGLSVIGMAGHALRDGISPGDGARLRSLRARFTSPVFPGDLLRLEAWNDAGRILFRLINFQGSEVIGRGVAGIQYVG